MRTDEAKFMNGAGSCKEYMPESLTFMQKIVQRSGIGPHSYMPDGTKSPLCGKSMLCVFRNVPLLL